MRWLARACLTLAMLASLAFAGLNLLKMAQNPLGRAFVDRTGAELAAAMEDAVARHATPARVQQRLAELLQEEPRNWVAINAVEALAAERAIPVAAPLLATRAEAYAQDHGFGKRAGNCAACAYDPGACELSATLICQAPMLLTPVGDLTSIIRESGNMVLGRDVDELDLGLSVVGFTAVLLTPATGGSSYLLGIGTRTTKLARKMGLISPPLRAILADALRRGVDWHMVSRSRSARQVAAAVDRDALRPVLSALDDLGRAQEHLSVPARLHLLRHVDTPADARRLGSAAEAMGSKMLGPLEVMGKSRFLRATMRISDQVWHVLAGIAGFAAAMGGMIASALSSALMRRTRRLPGENAVALVALPPHLLARRLRSP